MEQHQVAHAGDVLLAAADQPARTSSPWRKGSRLLSG
jgi:hypothetical protein